MCLMRRIGCALSIAAFAFSLANVASASAEDKELVLCKKQQALCEEKNIYPAHTAIKLLAENVNFLDMGVECEHREVKAETLQSMAEFLEIEVTSAKYSGCSKCKEVDPNGLPARRRMFMENGSYYLEFGILVTLLECGTSKLSCTFGAETVKAPINNTELGIPEVEIKEVPLVYIEGTGGLSFCGAKTGWDASSTLTAEAGGPIWFSLFELAK